MGCASGNVLQTTIAISAQHLRDNDVKALVPKLVVALRVHVVGVAAKGFERGQIAPAVGGV